MTEQTGQYVGIQAAQGFINLALGQPAPQLLPLGIISRAASRIGGADPLLLQYGAGRGFADFRSSLAAFLSRTHGITIAPDELVAAGAISLSLSLVADVFARRGGVVVVEDPTYFLAPPIFESAGIEVVSIPVDEHGLQVDELRRRIDEGLSVDLVYTIASFHNPTGASMPLARREALIALAAEKDFIVAADEPYNLLYFADERPVPMACLDQGRDRVLSISSFTKILAPGLRLGWLHGSPALLDRYMRHGTLVSGGALNPLMAFIVQGVIDSGDLDAHLQHLRDRLAKRCTALCCALEEELPEVTFVVPKGGYFVWATFPEGVSTRRLLSDAKALDVGFTPGLRCGRASDFERSMRLSFAFYDEVELREGVRRIAEAWRPPDLHSSNP
ncbi:MAG: PLP-dependent aminotransferase family protein [Myxococcales bacterium]|nr:PLP-dependent aminotransferase family protein [Myxococcales bacterium]